MVAEVLPSAGHRSDGTGTCAECRILKQVPHLQRRANILRKKLFRAKEIKGGILASNQNEPQAVTGWAIELSGVRGTRNSEKHPRPPWGAGRTKDLPGLAFDQADRGVERHGVRSGF